MYFGSKEELFAVVLRNAIESWATETLGELASLGNESSPATLASVLADSFQNNPDLCRLLAQGPFVLELGVQMEEADSALRVLHHRIEALGQRVEDLVDQLNPGDGYALIRRLVSTVLGSFSFAQPRGALAMALCDERLVGLRVDLHRELEEVALSYLTVRSGTD
jgi:AcrR family transcriptional regulator